MNSMYPKVRVREQQEEDEAFSPPEVDNGGSQLFLKVTDSSHSLQEKENQADSPPSIARIRVPAVPNLTTPPSVPAFKGEVKIEKQVNEKRKSNVRSAHSSVLRPRAVLSSPDNDGMIGKRNKLNNERSSPAIIKLEEKLVSVKSKVPGNDLNKSSKASFNSNVGIKPKKGASGGIGSSKTKPSTKNP